MNREELNLLDKRFLEINSNYPIKGTFLEKLNFANINKLSISDKEKSELSQRAMAEGGNGLRRCIQHLFSLYPYEG